MEWAWSYGPADKAGTNEEQTMNTYQLPDRDRLVDLLTSIQRDIRDDYRCTDDPDDDIPGMLVTVGASPDGSWNYQTGDNSYSGGAYLHHFWGIGHLYRDSNPEEVADCILDELADGMENCPDQDDN